MARVVTSFEVRAVLREPEWEAVRAAFGREDMEPWLGFLDGAHVDLVRTPPARSDALATDPELCHLAGNRFVFLSLFADVVEGEPKLGVAEARASWTEILARLRRHGARPFLLNVFRNVAEPRGEAPLRDPSGMRERIRRFNQLAAQLTSNGAAVLVDIDGALASAGGRSLAVDFAWTMGPAVTEAASAVLQAVSAAVVLAS
jgi:hypothetical protein